MMTNNLGSSWYKFDFHTHTPHSKDYREPTPISPQDWLKAIMAKEIDCVAITDHNSGTGVDELKAIYSQITNEPWIRQLTIFPGFELTVSLGSGRVHLLAIFDPSLSSQDLIRILGSCQLNTGGEMGDPEKCFSTLSLTDVVNRIRAANGIVMPAHIEGPKGLLHGITTTNPDLSAHLKLFDSAQFINPEILNSNTLHYDLKTDCSHLATVKGSDAHTLAELGLSYSWIKMGIANIDGLRYALRDKNYCILNQTQNPNQIPSFYIKQLTIKEMTHCGRIPNKFPTFSLHPLFNAIIGGRGTGKSTFIESLRLSLGKTQDTVELENVHEEIQKFVNGVTNEKTEVEILAKNHATDYKSKWTKNNPIAFYKYENQTWIKDEGNIKERLPVNLYSQKQINALAANPNSLLEIIDRSLNINKQLINTQTTQCMALLAEERALMQSISTEGSLRSELSAIDANILSYQAGGHNLILSQYELSLNIQQLLTRLLDVSEIKNKFDLLLSTSYPSLSLDHFSSLDGQVKKELVHIDRVLYNELSDIYQQIKVLKERLEQAISNANFSFQNSSWYKFKNSTEIAYHSMVSDYASKGIPFNISEYEAWNRRKGEITHELVAIGMRKERLQENLKERQNCIDEIIRIRKEIQQSRQNFIDSVLSGNNYVKISVHPFGETKNIESTFREIISTSNFSNAIYNDERKETSLLNELINISKTAEQKIQAKTNLIQNIHSLLSGKSLPNFNIESRFTAHLVNKFQQQPEIYGRLLTWLPEDLLEIKYSRNGNGQDFINISKGSAGQKAAAILAFLLSHGNEPIIVDQPEDDLDNALIYDLIVNQIQNNKNKRQIIIVTHNPNIVVNGDADLVNVMHFHKGQIEIKNFGSLVNENIRQDVCEIMEGGKDAFRKRYERIAM